MKKSPLERVFGGERVAIKVVPRGYDMAKARVVFLTSMLCSCVLRTCLYFLSNEIGRVWEYGLWCVL